jgi:hypothetical protein
VNLPATASSGIAAVVGGAPRDATVLAAFDRAVYLAHADGVLAIETSDGTGLPNGLVVAAPSTHRPLAGASSVPTATLGRGQVVLGDLTVRAVRWRRARPVLPRVRAPQLAATVAAARSTLAGRAPALPPELTASLATVVAALGLGDEDGAVRAARCGLLGRGAGLTPAGDDVLAGLISGVVLLTEAVRGRAGRPLATTAHRVGSRLADAAPDATTAISAALLRHAADGEVAEPAAQLLRALVGFGASDEAIAALLTVGSSSGRDLAAGTLAAAELVLAPVAPLGRER